MKKNALISLEFLVGIILSMAALVVVIDAFNKNYFTDLSNLDVAEMNAEKIADFINYAFVNSDYSGCFFILKTIDRQFFQEDNQDKYFYVVKKKFLYVFDDKLLDEFKKTDFDISAFEYEKNSILKYELNNEIKIKEDLTQDGNVLAGLDLFMTNTLFGVGSSTDLVLGEPQDNILVILDNKERLDFFIYKYKVQGSGNHYSQPVKNLENLDSHYLVFQEGDLYPSSSDVTSMIAKTNLCVGVMSSVDAKKNYYKNHLDEFDFYNFKITIKSKDVQNKDVYTWNPTNSDFCEGSLSYCPGTKIKDKFENFLNVVNKNFGDNFEVKNIVDFSEEIKITNSNFDLRDITNVMSVEKYEKLKTEADSKLKEGQIYYDSNFEYYILIVDEVAYFTKKDNIQLSGLMNDYYYDRDKKGAVDSKKFNFVDTKFLRISSDDKISVGNYNFGPLSLDEVDDVNYDGIAFDNIELYSFFYVSENAQFINAFYLTKEQYNKISDKRVS